MYDRLLFSKEITIPLIIKEVAEASNISVTDMTGPNGKADIRKREKVSARQISMALSKKYTKKSLAQIGLHHGGRDHATVLHACKTIGNLLDTRDESVSSVFFKVDKVLEGLKRKSLEPVQKKTFFDKNDVIKSFIKMKIPLYDREKILKELNFYTYDRYSMAALSVRVQKIH